MSDILPHDAEIGKLTQSSSWFDLSTAILLLVDAGLSTNDSDAALARIAENTGQPLRQIRQMYWLETKVSGQKAR